MQWRRIDKTTVRELPHLDETDSCFYYLDYTPGGYSQSQANSLISNFKKPMDRKGRPEWYYKEQAIDEFSSDLVSFLSGIELTGLMPVLIPMPTSKRRDSSDYDDRIVQVVAKASRATEIPWVDTFEVLGNKQAAHLGGSRRRPDIAANLRFVSNPAVSCDNCVCFLIDDVITTGAHYAVCRDMIKQANPSALVIGAFWARFQRDSPSMFAYGSITFVHEE